MLRKAYIQNELEELESSLAKGPTVQVYTVPDGYFEGLGEMLQRSLQTPILADKSNVFEVPEGYFDHLPSSILHKIHQPAPVVVMSQSRRLMQFAVAACMAGLIGLGIFWANKRTDAGNDMELTAALQEAHVILNSNNFETEMGNLPDDDIVQYLHLNGSDVNAALVASLADEPNIPSEEEYIYNDQTLDRVIKKLHINMKGSY